MAYSFLTFDTDDKQRITAWSIFRADVIPWVVSAGLALLVFTGVVLLVGSMDPDHDGGFIYATAILSTFAAPLYYALVVVACLFARRSYNLWTWTLSGILIVFFIGPNEMNFATAIFPNSILPAMVAMIGFLAFGRIVEYVRMHYILKLDTPTLGWGALILYSVLVVGAVFLDSSLLYALFDS